MMSDAYIFNQHAGQYGMKTILYNFLSKKVMYHIIQ